jgi:hypothetical protein
VDALIFIVLALALGSGQSMPEDPVAMSRGRNALAAMLAAAPGLDQTQRDFLIFVAYGESRWSSGAANKSASEARAAGVAYDRHADFFKAECPEPRVGYVWGSGGWFGMLPANGVWLLRNSLPCWPGSYVFDPAASITAAIAFARALQGWEGFKANPTVANLRIGWGNPSAMSKPHDPAKIAKFREHARKAGFDETFILRPVKRFPGNFAAIFAALSEAAT